jgi:hypothetical protein
MGRHAASAVTGEPTRALRERETLIEVVGGHAGYTRSPGWPRLSPPPESSAAEPTRTMKQHTPGLPMKSSRSPTVEEREASSHWNISWETQRLVPSRDVERSSTLAGSHHDGGTRDPGSDLTTLGALVAALAPILRVRS